MVILLAIAALALNYYIGFVVALPFWFLFALTVFLFRDFPRRVPAIPLANVSPVDGKVTEVGETTDPFLKRKALRVSIKQNTLGEFNLHSPNEGKVQNRWFPVGRFGGKDKASRQFAIWIQTDEGDDVVLAVDIVGALRYMRCRIRSGERLGQGQRWGLAAFGRPVEVYLPLYARPEVDAGQSLKAGSDIIARFIRSS